MRAVIKVTLILIGLMLFGWTLQVNIPEQAALEELRTGSITKETKDLSYLWQGSRWGGLLILLFGLSRPWKRKDLTTISSNVPKSNRTNSTSKFGNIIGDLIVTGLTSIVGLLFLMFPLAIIMGIHGHFTKPKASSQTVVNSNTETKYFKDMECTDDCSGHKAGYYWAKEKEIYNTELCEGHGQSFLEGCVKRTVELLSLPHYTRGTPLNEIFESDNFAHTFIKPLLIQSKALTTAESIKLEDMTNAWINWSELETKLGIGPHYPLKKLCEFHLTKEVIDFSYTFGGLRADFDLAERIEVFDEFIWLLRQKLNFQGDAEKALNYCGQLALQGDEITIIGMRRANPQNLIDLGIRLDP